MKYFLIVFLLSVLIVGAAVPANAQPGTPNGTAPTNVPNGTAPNNQPNGTAPNNTPNGTAPVQGGLTNPLNNIDSLPELLTAVLRAIVEIGTIILVLALVYVGFLFVVAQGNEEKIRNARSALLWTLIGGLILLGATAIGEVIKATVGTL